MLLRIYLKTAMIWELRINDCKFYSSLEISLMIYGLCKI